MAKFKLKEKARILRKLGKGIGEISRELSISKSTASYWCSEITLTKRQQELIKEKMIKAGHRGRLIGAQKNKDKKISAQKKRKEMG